MIGAKAAQTNYYADMQAARIGFPINFRVTINFRILDIPPEYAGRVFAKVCGQRFSKWVQRPKRGAGEAAPSTYHYAFENKRGDTAYLEIGDGLPHNVHVHWSMHVPAGRERDFEIVMHSWVDEIFNGQDWPTNALLIEPISYGKPARYLNKGAREDIATRYGANPDKVSAQGAIIGRRSGTSRNIGPTQRRIKDALDGIDRRKRIHYGQSFQDAPPPR